MLARIWLVASLLVVANRAWGVASPWVLHGHVLDSRGKPAAGVDLSVIWNANGVTLEELQRIQQANRGFERLATNEGHMEPWGDHPIKTDAQGRFAYHMSWTNYFLLAIDKQRQQGALVLVDSQNSSADVEVKLGPLVRLRGQVRIAGAKEKPEDVRVVARVPESDEFPLRFNRLSLCISRQARFEILLPPGNYELEANGDLAGRTYELAKYRAIRLGVRDHDFDAGILELTPRIPGRLDRVREAQAKGTWREVDPQKLYGQPAPKWYAIDTRGIPKDAQVSDLKGKWVLAYFWGPWCTPCLGREIPALMEFYDAHAAERDRFEIVGICTTEPQIKTMADLDRELKPVVKAVWHGRPIPFPIVLDNTLRSTENFGVAAHKLLFDPQGRLVPGDEKTLATKLKSTR